MFLMCYQIQIASVFFLLVFQTWSPKILAYNFALLLCPCLVLHKGNDGFVELIWKNSLLKFLHNLRRIVLDSYLNV